MVIALLVALGVDLIVIVAFAALTLGRKRWLKRQPGEFAGAIRISRGEIDGVSSKWKRGSCRWVRDVVVWTHGPLMLRNVLIPIDCISGEHAAPAGEVKRLGDTPVIVALESGDATVEIAAEAENRDLAVGPIATSPTLV